MYDYVYITYAFVIFFERVLCNYLFELPPWVLSPIEL